MSVSRRASFAAGIAAARRNNPNKGRPQGNIQQYSAATGSDSENTITVIAGGASVAVVNIHSPSDCGGKTGSVVVGSGAGGGGQLNNLASVVYAKQQCQELSSRKLLKVDWISREADSPENWLHLQIFFLWIFFLKIIYQSILLKTKQNAGLKQSDDAIHEFIKTVSLYKLVSKAIHS